MRQCRPIKGSTVAEVQRAEREGSEVARVCCGDGLGASDGRGGEGEVHEVVVAVAEERRATALIMNRTGVRAGWDSLAAGIRVSSVGLVRERRGFGAGVC